MITQIIVVKIEKAKKKPEFFFKKKRRKNRNFGTGFSVLKPIFSLRIQSRAVAFIASQKLKCCNA